MSGLSFCTYAAGGADSSGYLNQARLFSHGRSVDDSRLPGSWPDGIDKLAPLGFRPTPDRRHLAPIYPPGYPLLMAPAFLIHERAPLPGRAALRRAHGVVDVCAGPQAARAGGRRRGRAAGRRPVPTFLYQLVQPMSDVPATAAWLLALYLARAETMRRAVGAGLATSVAILIRPNLMPLALLVWVHVRARRRRRRPLATGGRVSDRDPSLAVILGVIQSTRYGSPLASGYGSVAICSDWRTSGPNLDRYPRWMIETPHAADPALSGGAALVAIGDAQDSVLPLSPLVFRRCRRSRVSAVRLLSELGVDLYAVPAARASDHVAADACWRST